MSLYSIADFCYVRGSACAMNSRACSTTGKIANPEHILLWVLRRYVSALWRNWLARLTVMGSDMVLIIRRLRVRPSPEQCFFGEPFFWLDHPLAKQGFGAILFLAWFRGLGANTYTTLPFESDCVQKKAASLPKTTLQDPDPYTPMNNGSPSFAASGTECLRIDNLGLDDS